MKKCFLAFAMSCVMIFSLMSNIVFAVEGGTSVEKEKINIVLVSGQSNAAGYHGDLDVPAITPDEGNGYWWDGDKLVDLKTKVDSVTDTSVGWYAPLAAEWYELTGEKVVIIRSTKSGSSIKSWASYAGEVKSATTSATKEVAQCIAAIQADETKQIVRTGYYWLQGETDAFIKTNSENSEYPTIAQYEAAYMAMHEKFVQALTVEDLPAPVGGILSCRTRTGLNYKNIELCSMRVAQQDLANSEEDIYMASVLMEDWTSSSALCTYESASGKYSVDTTAKKAINSIHYNQSGYNAMGLDAADNMYAALIGNAPIVTDIAVIAHDSLKTYESGDEIEVADNMRTVGALNETYDTNVAQIAFRPLPISAEYADLTITVTDRDGKEVKGVIDETGRISDISKITSPLTLTVTAGSVEKRFTLRNAANEEKFEISGTISSYGDATGEIVVELWYGETKVDTVTTTNDTYKLEGVLNGSYTVKFSKDNHAARSYTAEVNNDDVVLNAEICLKGDVTGDGKVNVIDYSRMYAHVNRTKPLTGYELECGNVVGSDVVVNVIDYSRMYAHVNGTKPLYE